MNPIGQVVYEVNLTIDPEIIEEFDAWLGEHVEAMLRVPGFVSASIYSGEPDSSVPDAPYFRKAHYVVTDREILEHYLSAQAAAMRADGLARFAGRFHVSRRILSTSAARDAAPRCLNCDAVLSGQYCPQCGQRASSRLISLWQLIREALGDLLDADSRLWRTVVALLLKPGFLTTEYLQGRRTRYLPPFRMYLILSLIFFIVAFFDPTFGIALGPEAPAAASDGSAADSPSESAADLPGAVVTMNGDGAASCDFDVEFPATLERLFPLQRAEEVCRKLIADDFRSFRSGFTDRLPATMFVFLPFLALILKILYPFSKRFYVEHLLFILHFQAFGFLIWTLLLLLERTAQWLSLLRPLTGWAELLVGLYLPAYLYFAMRRVYSQGLAMTSLKYVVMVLAYLICALFIFLVAALLSILSV